MKHSNFSRILSFLLALVMVLSMAPARVFASNSATYTRVDVSAPSDITAGTYLIYGTSSQATDNGSNSAFMSTSGSTNTRLMSSALEITDGTVTTDDANCVWNLIEAEGGFLVQNAGNGKYLYYGKAMEGKAPKRVTDRPLEYTKTKNPRAGPFWDRALCAAEMPAFREVKPGHFVACHRVDEVN